MVAEARNWCGIILCVIKREAKFQTKFSRWVQYRWPKEKNAHFELKVTKNGPLPFRAVSLKQKGNLRRARKWFFHKYSDFSRFGTDFDCTFVGPADSYVVVQFDRPKQKEFFICPIEVFLEEEAVSSEKSLSEDRARIICRSEHLA